MRLAYWVAALMMAASPALAQQGPPAPRVASKDPIAAPPGTYDLDTRHVAVTIKVLRGGFAYSLFRMGGVQGALTWAPDAPAKSKVTAVIAANSVMTNVPGFGDALAGPRWLNAAQFPTITFASTSIKRTGPTTGEITGDLTLRGITKPVTLQTTLVGVGQGKPPVIGFSAVGHVSRSAFGVGPATPAIADDLEISIDLEFDKTA